MHWSIVPICRRTSFTFKLQLRPVSSHIRPNDASSLRSARCLVFPVVNSTSLKVFFLDFPPAWTSWGSLTGVVLWGEGVSLTPNQRLVDQSSMFMSPGDRVFQLHPGHCESILIASYNARNTSGLFFFPANTRGKGLIIIIIIMFLLPPPPWRKAR